jgi:hypothetical protein
MQKMWIYLLSPASYLPSMPKQRTPYAVGIVELDDGVKLTGQIVDCDFENSERFSMWEKRAFFAMATSSSQNKVAGA